jgi:uncharacterized protein (TIGR00369 family)
VFERAAFVGDLGVALAALEPGRCETTLDAGARHGQQDGFVHAGVLVTMADHTAGVAAATLLDPGQSVRTFEMHVRFVRPARGRTLTCVGTVERPGRTVSFAEADVRCDGETVARASVTLSVVNVEW